MRRIVSVVLAVLLSTAMLAVAQCSLSLVRVLAGHTNPVTSIAFAPDGKMIASASEGHDIKLWNVSTGVLLRTLTGHTKVVNSIAFSPDGRTLASGSDDGTAKLWNPATGGLLATTPVQSRMVGDVAFSPDGRVLAFVSRGIQLWDVETFSHRTTLPDSGGGAVDSIAISPDGRTLASGSHDDTVKLWSLATGALLRTLTGHTQTVESVAFSPDGRTIASGSFDGTVKFWDTSTGGLLRTVSGTISGVWSVAFSPDGETLASGQSAASVKLWNATTGTLVCETSVAHIGAFTSVAFSPDGQLVAGAREGTVSLWKISTGTSAATPPPTLTPTYTLPLPNEFTISYRWQSASYYEGDTSTPLSVDLSVVSGPLNSAADITILVAVVKSGDPCSGVFWYWDKKTTDLRMGAGGTATWVVELTCPTDRSIAVAVAVLDSAGRVIACVVDSHRTHI